MTAMSETAKIAPIVRGPGAGGEGSPSTVGAYVVRLLEPGDVDRLMELERAKWTDEQATNEDEMRARLRAYPTLSFGAFSVETGEALVSIFLKPISDAALAGGRTWADCACVDDPVPQGTTKLFGISVSSNHADALDAVDEFMWPVLLKGGWRHLYLGSPLPGLRAWRRANPTRPVDEYVLGRRGDLPRDPQLRYYHGKGFKEIISFRPDYFPHEASQDWGAVIRRPIPWSAAAPLWRRLPQAWLCRLTRVVTALV